MGRLLCVVLMLSMSVGAYAGGSCDFEEDVKPILMQQPKLGEHLLATLDIYRTASAETRIGSSVNEELGGTRLGPYMLYAKPKDTKGPYVFELTVNTKAVFLDAEGKKTKVDKAASVKETLENVQLSVLKEPFTPEE
jgi:hypothetical protein